MQPNEVNGASVIPFENALHTRQITSGSRRRQGASAPLSRFYRSSSCAPPMHRGHADEEPSSSDALAVQRYRPAPRQPAHRTRDHVNAGRGTDRLGHTAAGRCSSAGSAARPGGARGDTVGTRPGDASPAGAVLRCLPDARWFDPRLGVRQGTATRWPDPGASPAAQLARSLWRPHT